MEAVIVTLAIIGVMGSSLHEPRKAKSTRAPRPTTQRPPAFVPVAWAPAPPPPAVHHHAGNHVLPAHFRN